MSIWTWSRSQILAGPGKLITFFLPTPPKEDPALDARLFESPKAKARVGGGQERKFHGSPQKFPGERRHRFHHRMHHRLHHRLQQISPKNTENTTDDTTDHISKFLAPKMQEFHGSLQGVRATQCTFAASFTEPCGGNLGAVWAVQRFPRLRARCGLSGFCSGQGLVFY